MRNTMQPRPLGRGGFTLTEIMIALGVVGVALGMAAAAFEAGLKSHNSAVSNAMRSLVAENAVAIARARLMYYGTATSDPNTTCKLAPIGPRDLSFPTRTADNDTSGRGYLLAAKQNALGKNDYTFRIRPYVLAKSTYKLEATAAKNCDISIAGANGPATLMASSGSLDPAMVVGAYVMAIYPDANTQTGRIVSLSPMVTVATATMTTLSKVPVTVLVVKDASGATVPPNSSDGRIDVLPEYVVTTSLRQAP